jgi:hypothetical protein
MKHELRELRRENEEQSKGKYEGWQSETTFEEDNPLWCKSEEIPTDQATV